MKCIQVITRLYDNGNLYKYLIKGKRKKKRRNYIYLDRSYTERLK